MSRFLWFTVSRAYFVHMHPAIIHKAQLLLASATIGELSQYR